MGLDRSFAAVPFTVRGGREPGRSGHSSRAVRACALGSGWRPTLEPRPARCAVWTAPQRSAPHSRSVTRYSKSDSTETFAPAKSHDTGHNPAASSTTDWNSVWSTPRHASFGAAGPPLKRHGARHQFVDGLEFI